MHNTNTHEHRKSNENKEEEKKNTDKTQDVWSAVIAKTAMAAAVKIKNSIQ